MMDAPIKVATSLMYVLQTRIIFADVNITKKRRHHLC